jgi:hypothetical protein
MSSLYNTENKENKKEKSYLSISNMLFFGKHNALAGIEVVTFVFFIKDERHQIWGICQSLPWYGQFLLASYWAYA